MILGMAMAISTVAGTLVGVLGPYLRSEIGITPTGLGLMVTVFAIASGALSWPAGSMTDAIGGRRALVIVFSNLRDEDDDTLMLRLSGTSQELDDCIAALMPYNIEELIRSGKIVMDKGPSPLAEALNGIA